jgi:hypothetical protein
MHNLNHGENFNKMWASSVISKKKLPKIDNHAMGENSLNLVTLLQGPYSNNVGNLRRRNSPPGSSASKFVH